MNQIFPVHCRERLTVTTSRSITPPPSTSDQITETHHNGATQTGTIRTDEYKRALAEFQARRSSGANEELAITPEKLKRCGRHNLPVACIDCTADDTFNYEKRSASKYKKNKRSQSNTPEKANALPQIQFLFQNQVFMPGNYRTRSEPRQATRYHTRRTQDFPAQKQLDFEDNELDLNLPCKKDRAIFLPLDIKSFLGNRSSNDNVDGAHTAGDFYGSSHEVNLDSNSAADKLSEAMAELKQLDQWADEQLMPKSPVTSRSDDSKVSFDLHLTFIDATITNDFNNKSITPY